LQFPALRATLLSISGRAPGLIFRRRIRGHRKERGHGGGERKKNDRDDGLPDKGRGTDCYEILSNARVSAQGASCSRSASRSKARCSRIRVFVDRANGTAGAYIFKTTFVVAIRLIRSLRRKIYTRKRGGIYRMSRTAVSISLHRCTKSRAETSAERACARLDVDGFRIFLPNFVAHGIPMTEKTRLRYSLYYRNFKISADLSFCSLSLQFFFQKSKDASA